MHGEKPQPISQEAPLIDRVLRIAQEESNIAVLMSGKGSNAESILKNRNLYPNLNFKMIVTDNPSSNGLKISQKYGIEFGTVGWNANSELPRENLFNDIARILSAKKIDMVIYAGFMRIATGEFVDQFPGINMHPADLTVLDETGKPKYTGMFAIKKALDAGEDSIASSVHIVDREVDCGFIIAVSKHLKVRRGDFKNTDMLHERLRKHREVVTYPLVLAQLSKGVEQTSLPLRY